MLSVISKKNIEPYMDLHMLHDEIIIEAKDDIANDVAGTVKNCMERAFSKSPPDVPFVVKPG